MEINLTNVWAAPSRSCAAPGRSPAQKITLVFLTTMVTTTSASSMGDYILGGSLGFIGAVGIGVLAFAIFDACINKCCKKNEEPEINP